MKLWIPNPPKPEREYLHLSEKDRKLLKGSLNKWYKIAYEGARDGGTTDCPLCDEYFYKETTCKGCPVAEWTGQTGCDGTPYETWVVHCGREHEGSRYVEHVEEECVECNSHVLSEIAFLRGLLALGDDAEK